MAPAKAWSLAEGAEKLQIDYSGHTGKISIVEPLHGARGMLRLDCLTVETLGQVEDHLLLSAVTASGEALGADVASRLLTIPGIVKPAIGQLPLDAKERRDVLVGRLTEVSREREAAIRRAISERSAKAFEAEADKLDGWADDLKLGLEREIKELDRQIKEARRAATVAVSLEEKLAAQKKMKALESERNQRRRALFDSQDEIDRKRGDLIAQLEAQLTQKVASECLFCVPWRIV